MTRPPAPWSRGRWFAVLAGSTLAATTAAVLVFAATEGVIAGRVTPAGGTAADAIRELAREGVRVGPSPRCVTPTLGDATTTLALGLTAAILYTLALAIAGAWALYRTGLGR